MKKHGPWTIRSTEQIYQDPFVELILDQVIRPDGAPGQHVVVHMKPGVCVLAIDDQNRVHLTKEFHYAVGRYSLEGVSGGIEPGESKELTAKRELKEELGLVARKWDDLGSCDPFTSIVLSPTQLYLARELEEQTASPEGTELIERVTLPLEDAVEKVMTGEITHGPTCILILKANLLAG
ncbi:MAG: NUDIX hydrolase [Planctomycetota bacterium]